MSDAQAKPRSQYDSEVLAKSLREMKKETEEMKAKTTYRKKAVQASLGDSEKEKFEKIKLKRRFRKDSDMVKAALHLFLKCDDAVGERNAQLVLRDPDTGDEIYSAEYNLLARP